MAGSGQAGIANGIMGLHPAGGSVSFEGRAIELNNPESPLAAGISAVSEDRRGVGLLLEESNLEYHFYLAPDAGPFSPPVRPGENP